MSGRSPEENRIPCFSEASLVVTGIQLMWTLVRRSNSCTPFKSLGSGTALLLYTHHTVNSSVSSVRGSCKPPTSCFSTVVELVCASDELESLTEELSLSPEEQATVLAIMQRASSIVMIFFTGIPPSSAKG